ncbi:hypothetical protein E2562_020601 [Oryza meyeriana var. granulata]|uniref:Uncharacterized protein n=1 Tax=Oryza meyeriana var. granulata TaxID=110450 RepID=A0A6G1DYA6_9ORYZ|nr:hypothetical protein E2562_020601 [Oryza meyeriana var. granulata]
MDPSSIAKSAWLSLTNPDEEGLPTNIPHPDMEPLRNPPPSEPKDGWTYHMFIHLDTLEDLELVLSPGNMVQETSHPAH